MLTLVSYPGLFGVADNNPYGLKVFAFLKLCDLTFRHEHVIDTGNAPRGQLPYVIDDGKAIGDSDKIVSHVAHKFALRIDDGLTNAEHDTSLLIRRTLDDLYWVMSYSRWKDPRFWPQFRDAFLKSYPGFSEEMLDAAREYNSNRYYYQGIGRYEPEDAYARGLADLRALGSLLAGNQFFFNSRPTSTDAGVYGFTANIYFYDIDTPLKSFLASCPDLVTHCRVIHEMITKESKGRAV